MIICNKQDDVNAKNVDEIKQMIESEIDVLRKTKIGSKKLKTTEILDNQKDEVNIDEENTNKIFFTGKNESNFKFSNLTNFKVNFVPTSCVQENDAFPFSNVDSWLNDQVKA